MLSPQLAPYGLAAQQTLVALGIYEQMSAQLVIGNNVNQAFQFVNTHNAVIGLLAKSQLIAAAGQHTDDAQRYQQFVAIPCTFTSTYYSTSRNTDTNTATFPSSIFYGVVDVRHHSTTITSTWLYLR